MQTLIGQLDALASGTVTSVSLTEQALAAVEASQPGLNAFRVIAADDARRAAIEADAARARGSHAALLGVPIVVKDDQDLQGHPTAFGCVGSFPPAQRDSELVARVKAAGAVVVGKTHSSELGQWPLTGLAGLIGHTRNPWSRAHTPGGSSGGTSAAVAAGLVAAGLGSDGAGSIRIPASWTNLVGIKPQRGRLSTWPHAEAFYGLTVNGPLTHTVSDGALLIDVLQGNHPDELHRPPRVALLEATRREPGRLRVGLSVRPPVTLMRPALHPRLRQAIADAGAVLRKLGHNVTDREPGYDPGIGLGFLTRSMTGLDDWRRALDGHAALDRRSLDNARNGRLLRPTMRAARLAEHAAAQVVMRAFRGANAVDVIVAPVTAQPPLRVEAIDGLSGARTDYVITTACPYAWPWNVLGWPSIAVPAGFTDDGLPIGIQLMGPANSEARLVSLAAQLENEWQWYRHRPNQWW